MPAQVYRVVQPNRAGFVRVYSSSHLSILNTYAERPAKYLQFSGIPVNLGPTHLARAPQLTFKITLLDHARDPILPR